MENLGIVFLAGLLGSAHCVGMCGGFVLTLNQPNQTAVPYWMRQWTYFMGKTLTYMFLGALIGSLGWALTAALKSVLETVSIVAGLVMIVFGLGLMGVLRQFGTNNALSKTAFYRDNFKRAIQKGGLAGAFGLGMLNGLLPCGLVYGVLASAAATQNPSQAATVMGVFGLATIPALALTAVLGQLLTPFVRQRMNQVGGVLLVLMGMMTVLRGTELGNEMLHRMMGHENHNQHTEMNHEGVDHSKMDHSKMNHNTP